MLDINQVYQGDCLEVMKGIDDKSIDMVLCDLPYGITQNKWDCVISLDLLWKEYKRIINENGVIVLTASQPFTSSLIMSNLRMFKYCWVWEKNVPTGFLNAKKQPLKWTEDIIIFYKKTPIYNPQFRIGKGYKVNVTSIKSKNYGKQTDVLSENDGTHYYPKNIIQFDNHNAKGKSHPTQKPLLLFEYLIKTYTNEKDLVLDNCAGSFTTAVACENLNRNWICIEKEQKYCDIGQKRIDENRIRLGSLNGQA